ncbi:hypothetical protein MMC07_008365 [Pseudocyphellaria aurata]|nr:hypothetical protein [Pseudocyphellaria aurata]
MEDCPLFNCGKGAVFTKDGTIELEASVMISKGQHKRGCGIVLVKKVKNPIYLAREMLIRGGTDDESGGPNGDGGGAQGHCCLGGETVEQLAGKWGCEIVPENYFWTRKRWNQHKRGLGKPAREGWEEKTAGKDVENDGGWDGHEYLAQGTVGCVALDQFGTLCVATSTGGLTNKLVGRIGDTPTIGAGFWAEEWEAATRSSLQVSRPQSQQHHCSWVAGMFPKGLREAMGSCFPKLEGYNMLRLEPCSQHCHVDSSVEEKIYERGSRAAVQAVAISGTGNGDFFLRLAAARTAAAIVRFSAADNQPRSLASAMAQIVGPSGEMQRAAGDRWGKTSEGQGGMIGIELVGGVGRVVFDFNCGGMFRGWVDESGKVRVMVFKDEF